jgi:hypothetical protein
MAMSSLDKQTKERLSDYFTGAELVEYLEEGNQLSVEDVIEVFEDEIADALDDINELMGVNSD